MTGSTDFERLGVLAQEAQGGNRAAYETLLNELYSFVRAVLRARLGAIPELDDLTQECLLGIHKSLPTYHPSRSIKPWVQAIMRYKISDHFRAQSKRKEFCVAPDVLDVTNRVSDANEQDGEESADRASLTALMARLPTALRKAVVLTKFEGLSCREAARREGVTGAALRKRVSRAYRQLARLVEKELDEEDVRG